MASSATSRNTKSSLTEQLDAALPTTVVWKDGLGERRFHGNPNSLMYVGNVPKGYSIIWGSERWNGSDLSRIKSLGYYRPVTANMVTDDNRDKDKLYVPAFHPEGKNDQRQVRVLDCLLFICRDEHRQARKNYVRDVGRKKRQAVLNDGKGTEKGEHSGKNLTWEMESTVEEVDLLKEEA